MEITNKQVIAAFFAGVLLLAAVFWAGVSVMRRQPPAPASEADTSAAAAKEEETAARYVVRVAAFGTLEEATRLRDELRRRYPSAEVQRPKGDDAVHRVTIGPYNSRDDARKVMNELAGEGFKGLSVAPWSPDQQ